MFVKLKNFLFSNQTISQTILKNSFWLGLADAINKILVFILLIYVARILGAADFGKFNFAVAVVYLFGILPGFLSTEIITREFSQDKDKEKDYSSLISLKIILGIGAVALLAIVSFFVSADPVIRKAIWFLSLYYFFLSFLDIFYAFFRARQRMEYEAFTKILDGVLSVTFSFVVILKFPSVVNLSLAYFAEGFVLLAAVAWFFHFKIYRLSFGCNRAVWQKMLSLSWPLALTSAVAVVYSYVDTFIMGFLGQMAQAGWYNAALKVTKVALAPISLISLSFYPVLSGLFNKSKDNFQKIWNRQMAIMIITAVPLVSGGIMLAPRIIGFVYDKTYGPAVFAFQILIVATGVVFLYDGFRQALIVANQQKKLFWAVLVGAVMNTVLNIVLIPRVGLYGAAFSSVVSNIAIFILLVKFALSSAVVAPFNREIALAFAGAAISSLAMSLAISWPAIYYLPVVFSIIIGAGVYFITLLTLKKLYAQYA